MGYPDERFLSPVHKSMICGVCLEVFRDPVELDCSGAHMLCRACVPSDASAAVVCPLDRQTCTFKQPHQYFRSNYTELKIRCQWSRYGCQQLLMIGCEARHEAECPFNGLITRECDCGFVGPRITSDGEEHDCVSFLKESNRQLTQATRLEVERLERQLERRTERLEQEIQFLKETCDLAKQQRNRAYDALCRLQLECRCHCGSGDA